jgi:hypothetical protein
MAQYHYLVATLPTISSDSNQFMSTESFLQLCHRWLTKGDSRLIEATTLVIATPQPKHKKTGTNHLIQHWHAFEIQLRNELVRQRALKLQREPSAYLRKMAHGSHHVAREWLVQGVRAAVHESNPLLAEQMLNNLLWRYLNDLERNQFFNVEFLQVYYLKLQLLERTAQFRTEQGNTHFQQAYAAAAKQLQGVAAIQI